jgi:hypothetical protein
MLVSTVQMKVHAIGPTVDSVESSAEAAESLDFVVVLRVENIIKGGNNSSTIRVMSRTKLIQVG